MRKDVKIYIFSVVCIILFVCGWFFIKGWLQIKKNENIKCQASFVISNYNLTMPVIASLRFDNVNGMGVLFYDGPVYSSGKRIGILSREVKFRAEYKDSNLIMTGTYINEPPKDNIPQDKAELMLPDFYVKPQASIFYTLRYDRNGYFFIRDGVPMFFCREVAG